MRPASCPRPLRTADDAPELASFRLRVPRRRDGPARGELVAALEAAGATFIDVGMGVDRAGPAGPAARRDTGCRSAHRPPCHVPTGTADDEYGSNIQVVELNAFNAALAVMAWKRITASTWTPRSEQRASTRPTTTRSGRSRMPDIEHRFVRTVPAVLAPNTLYVSRKYGLAVHLCMCGCGTKVVTPLGPAEWSVRLEADTITLRPSVGNGGFPCKSHYLITRSTVHWLPLLTTGSSNARWREMRTTSTQTSDAVGRGGAAAALRMAQQSCRLTTVARDPEATMGHHRDPSIHRPPTELTGPP